jgi:hypothetical protein
LRLEVLLDKGPDNLVDAGVGGKAEGLARGAASAAGQPEMMRWISGSGSQRILA